MQGLVSFSKAAAFPPGPGEWFRCPDGALVIGCPQCKVLSPIKAPPHEVLDDGRVAPSVVCPSDHCNFHEMVKLEGICAEPDTCLTCGHKHEGEKGVCACGCLSRSEGWKAQTLFALNQLRVAVAPGTVFLVFDDKFAFGFDVEGLAQTLEALAQAAAHALALRGGIVLPPGVTR